jgi:phage-related protein
MSEKPIIWAGTSLDDIRAFPEDARRLAGQHLRLVQQGLEPPDWKPMPGIGLKVAEIRIHTRVDHRVFLHSQVPRGNLRASCVSEGDTENR